MDSATPSLCVFGPVSLPQVPGHDTHTLVKPTYPLRLMAASQSGSRAENSLTLWSVKTQLLTCVCASCSDAARHQEKVSMSRGAQMPPPGSSSPQVFSAADPVRENAALYSPCRFKDNRKSDLVAPSPRQPISVREKKKKHKTKHFSEEQIQTKASFIVPVCSVSNH